jgi:pectinesterase
LPAFASSSRSIAAAALVGAGAAMAANPAGAGIRVILVGDSTMAARTGYGDALCALFTPDVTCINLARGGRSSKSFRADGSWDRVKALLVERPDNRDTYVLIQFGHNDQPGKAERSTDLATEFPANITRYADEVRRTGARPVLVTPLTRRTFRDGVLAEDLVPWANATRSVARLRQLPLLDLNTESMLAVSRMGEAEADTLAKEGEFDHTHLGVKGAAYFSRIVARELAEALPMLAPRIGAAPQAAKRPQLTDAQAAMYAHGEVLRGWDPLADPLATGAPLTPDYVVDAAGTANNPATFSTVQAAVNEAAAARRERRVYILVKPGTYREVLQVPDAAPITLYGADPDARQVRVTASLDATSLKDGKPVGTPGSATVRIRNPGFQAKNLTFENAYNKDGGDSARHSQAVAVMVDDADRVQFENVRFVGFQDTLYLRATSPERPARVFLHRSYIEGDMDFIFGEAAALFLRTEIRTLGDRAMSYITAASTHVQSRYGFVFEECAFTHDGSANALAGVFKLGRQYFPNQSPDAVGKVAILRSRIGAHVDRLRPWADWGVAGAPRYRPVQYDSADYRANQGLPGKVPVEPFLAEYHNTLE